MTTIITKPSNHAATISSRMAAAGAHTSTSGGPAFDEHFMQALTERGTDVRGRGGREIDRADVDERRPDLDARRPRSDGADGRGRTQRRSDRDHGVRGHDDHRDDSRDDTHDTRDTHEVRGRSSRPHRGDDDTTLRDDACDGVRDDVVVVDPATTPSMTPVDPTTPTGTVAAGTETAPAVPTDTTATDAARAVTVPVATTPDLTVVAGLVQLVDDALATIEPPLTTTNPAPAAAVAGTTDADDTTSTSSDASGTAAPATTAKTATTATTAMTSAPTITPVADTTPAADAAMAAAIDAAIDSAARDAAAGAAAGSDSSDGTDVTTTSSTANSTTGTMAPITGAAHRTDTTAPATTPTTSTAAAVSAAAGAGGSGPDTNSTGDSGSDRNSGGQAATAPTTNVVSGTPARAVASSDHAETDASETTATSGDPRTAESGRSTKPLLGRVDTRRLDIDLSDEGLGQLRLHTSTQGGAVHVSMQAADPQVRDAIARQSYELRRDLEASGITVGSFDVSAHDQGGLDRRATGQMGDSPDGRRDSSDRSPATSSTHIAGASAPGASGSRRTGTARSGLDLKL